MNRVIINCRRLLRSGREFSLQVAVMAFFLPPKLSRNRSTNSLSINTTFISHIHLHNKLWIKLTITHLNSLISTWHPTSSLISFSTLPRIQSLTKPRWRHHVMRKEFLLITWPHLHVISSSQHDTAKFPLKQLTNWRQNRRENARNLT